MSKKKPGKIETAWNDLFAQYDIVERVRHDGRFPISADQIKKPTKQEPRLMAKFDHRDALPKVFKDNNLGILPVARGDYLIGPFNLFFELPQPNEAVPLKRAVLPSCVSSISPTDISSETIALNCAFDSKILHQFLGEERLFPTLSGRMGSSCFDFRISDQTGTIVSPISVNGAQIEVDAAYEGEHSLTLFEAKMNLGKDFVVRQLYYPFRHFQSLSTGKTIRTVFFTYSGGLFYLAEYAFENQQDYNSVTLIRNERYCLDGHSLSKADLYYLLDTTIANPEPNVPFPQADTLARVVNLCERLAEGEMMIQDFVSMYGLTDRQAYYYFDSLVYLGYAKHVGGRGSPFTITEQGRHFVLMERGQRNRSLMMNILRHEAFRRTLQMSLNSGSVPDLETIRDILRETNPNLGRPDSDTFRRRTRTVRNWIRWMIDLSNGNS